MTDNLPVYTVRPNALEPERTWRLQDGALHWNNKLGPQQIAFSNVTDIRFEYAPTRVNPAQYRCHVGSKSGRTETIPSTHCVGIADFADRASTYCPFVLALVQQVVAANPGCRLHGGATLLQYVVNVAAVVLAAVVLAFVPWLGGIQLSFLVLVEIALVAWYLPKMLYWFRCNMPARLNAGQGIDRALLQPYLPPQP